MGLVLTALGGLGGLTKLDGNMLSGHSSSSCFSFERLRKQASKAKQNKGKESEAVQRDVSGSHIPGHPFQPKCGEVIGSGMNACEEPLIVVLLSLINTVVPVAPAPTSRTEAEQQQAGKCGTVVLLSDDHTWSHSHTLVLIDTCCLSCSISLGLPPYNFCFWLASYSI